MSWDEYDSRNIPKPYILELEKGRGRLLYFGVEHTACAEHPNLAQLEQAWEDFRPTLALSEGGVWPLMATREEAIHHYGEGGLLRLLAERDQVPIRSLEPSRADEVAELGRHFPRETVRLFYILRYVPPFRRKQSDEPLDDYVRGVMAHADGVSGLNGPPGTLAELDELSARTFPQLDDWRQVPADWFDPSQTGTLMNQIARRLCSIRDEHMSNLIADQVLRGERVFAVAGYTHVVMQEETVRQALK